MRLAAIVLLLGCSSNSGLSTEALDERVAAQRDTLEECVGEEEVSLTAKLTIGPEGDVTSVKADGEAADCVQGIIRTWTFPASDDTTEAELPLTLRPTPPS